MKKKIKSLKIKKYLDVIDKIEKVRNKNNVSVYYGDNSEFFSYDKVILATHADEALNLIKNPMENEFNVLKNFRYKENIALVHSY